MNFNNVSSLFKNFNKTEVLVIGDAMLDSYHWGEIHRQSPEANVPVVSLLKKENRLGGAANVAKNILALGANVTLCSTIGNDEAGKHLLNLMHKNNLSTDYLIKTHNITTQKIRIFAKNKHVIRIDNENTSSIENKEKILELIKKIINSKKIDIAIIQDYNKGLLNKKTIKPILNLLKEKKIKITVDPKFNNFNDYKEVDLIKPNLIELNNITNKKIVKNDIEKLLKTMKETYVKLNVKYIMTTLSENGLMILKDDKNFHAKGLPINVIDVSGAGDSVISIASLCLANNIPMEDIAKISNYSGAQVCEKIGVVTINKLALLKKIKKQYS